MIITYDTQVKTLLIKQEGNYSWGTDIIISLNRHGQTVSLKDVSFGITVQADDEIILKKIWPPENVKFSKTNQDILATARVEWIPDQTICIEAWYVNIQGEMLTVTDSFIALRPAQPYPSWIWDSNKWVAPEPYPNSDDYYQWDESRGSWVKFNN